MAILCDFLGMEHTNFALDWGMFFFLLNIFHHCLTNFDERKGRECVIVQTTHGGSKSREPLYTCWEHSSTVYFFQFQMCSVPVSPISYKICTGMFSKPIRERVRWDFLAPENLIWHHRCKMTLVLWMTSYLMSLGSA